MKRKQVVARIEDGLAESAFVKLLLVQSCVPVIAEICETVVKALRRGKRVFLFGNGGSAADAQHLAGEMEGRLKKNRRALPIQALTTNTSTLTAVGNDLGFEQTFSRQVEAYVGRGDVVIAISTSGNSKNVLEAVKVARRKGAVSIGFTKRDGGRLAKMAKICFRAPTDDTQRAQECHITAGHLICEIVEASLFR